MSGDNTTLPDWGQLALAAAVSRLLLDRVTLTPGLGLVAAFPELSDLVDRPALLRLLILYVQICIDADRLKSAARATRLFSLRQEFPDIEARYRRSSLARLASKRVWGVAAAFVGTDAELQTELLRAMVEAGEGGLAEEYRKRFGLPPALMAALIDPEALAAQEAARAAKYLPLALPSDRVIWADGPEGLAAAAEALAGAQVATADWAVLFDLIALCGPGSSSSAAAAPGGEQEAAAADATAATTPLDAVLLPLFSRTPAEGGCLVLGFGLSGDLAKLSGSYPAVAAFRRVAATLDVWELWRAHLIAQAQAARPKVSDWEARPLSARQMTYAAQDAHVLVRLYGELRNRLPAGVADQVEAVKTVSYTAGASPSPVGPRSNGGTPQKRKVAAAVGVARRALRVATPGECVSAYGYVPGTLPPFGHPSPVPVLYHSHRGATRDAHVGGCRWLRCLGLDAEYVGRTSPGKQELARLTARAASEGRVFLTRDQRLAERRDVAAPHVLGSDDPQQQLDELAQHFGLVCPKEAARELVPPRVYDLVDEFWRCGCCGKVFWMGPKSASAIALAARPTGAPASVLTMVLHEPAATLQYTPGSGGDSDLASGSDAETQPPEQEEEDGVEADAADSLEPQRPPELLGVCQLAITPSGRGMGHIVITGRHHLGVAGGAHACAGAASPAVLVLGVATQPVAATEELDPCFADESFDLLRLRLTHMQPGARQAAADLNEAGPGPGSAAAAVAAPAAKRGWPGAGVRNQGRGKEAAVAGRRRRRRSSWRRRWCKVPAAEGPRGCQCRGQG
eukprot:XP_001701715.1 predicted protein [Chlamydomonas reinhardtii]